MAGENSYSELSVFREPVCLIGEDEDNKLAINQSVLDQIQQINKPVNVVAIAGLYRTGKSYLMNRLAGENKGFSLGSTIQSKTKGIWVWCRPHPEHDDQVLVLLDTEGLGDVEKGDRNHDNWIFALATLLSSTLVYNTLGAFDQDTIEKLNFITEISKHIKTRKTNDDKTEMKTDDGNKENTNKDFDLYFPTFVIALRDFALVLEKDGQEITSDEYLEHCLTLRPETNVESKKFNDPRRCIRRFFTKRKCFTFDRPAGRKKLIKLEELTDGDLSEDFVDEVAAFCKFIYSQCAEKKLDTGIAVTGRMLVTLITTYVEAIRNGAVPCIENALNAMAILENTKATEEAVEFYQTMMSDMVQMPTETDAIISEAHHACVKEAVSHFLKKAIYDEENKFQRKMNLQLEGEFEAIKLKNAEASELKCREVLQLLNLPIMEKLESGTYMSSGGYFIYQQDLQQLQKLYESEQGLGVKAEDVIASFLHEKRTEGQTILAADQKVSEEEKKVEEERQKALQATRDREAAQRESELIKKHAEDVERTLKENLEQVKRRREEDLANMQKHYDNVIQTRLAEQERTMREGFAREADSMKAQISQMAEQKRAHEQRYAEDAKQTREMIQQMSTENQRREETRRQELKDMSERYDKREDRLRDEAKDTLKQVSEAGRIREERLYQERMESDRRAYEQSQALIAELGKDKGGGGGCFADTSLIKMKGSDGRVFCKTLSELNVGDSVESFDFVSGEVVFSIVYFITHSEEGDTNDSELLFLKLEKDESDDRENGIRLDANHLLYVSRADGMSYAGRPIEQPVKACDVVVGDKLWVRKKSELEAKKVEAIRPVRSGIRHPMTMNHVIIVDGILASVHMHNERVYRVLTSPLRFLYFFSPTLVQSGVVRNLVKAWDYMENFL